MPKHQENNSLLTRQIVGYSAFLTLSGLAFYYMHIAPEQWNMGERFNQVVETGRFIDDNPKWMLRKTYTGIEPLDAGLSFFVAAFTPGIHGWDQGFHLQQQHFLFTIMPMLATFIIEACRVRNRWALITFTSVWALFYQTVGGAVIIPLYYVAYLYTTAREGYFDSPRQIPLNKAKALLPALIIGYIVPTLATYIPSLSESTRQATIAFWQVSPIVVDILLFLFTPLFSNDADKITSAATRSATSVPGDIKYLNRIYALCLATAIPAHLYTMYTCLTSSNPEHSLTHVFISSFIASAHASKNWTMTQLLFFVWQVDWWGCFVTVLLACVLAVYDLERLGRTNVGVFQAIVLLMLGSVVIGPGAVLAAVWWWREGSMVGGSRGGKDRVQ